MRTWGPVRERILAQLERQTKRGVREWDEAIRVSGIADDAALRSWLAARGVTGYPQMLLVWETFGYPDFLLASADELVDAQYADRPRLRPVLDALYGVATGFGGVDVQARKTYVAFLTPRRTFAVAQPTTKRRVDLGLRLDDHPARGRLEEARHVGGGAINRRVALGSVDDLDDEVLAWLRHAYESSR
jgi:hypothetical protein